MAAPAADTRSLHDIAAEAASDVRKLQVGLAHAGASPQALQALGTMGETLDAVVKTLASAPEVEDAAKNGPAVDENGQGGPQGPLAPQTPANHPHPGAPQPQLGHNQPIPGRAPGAVGGPPPNGPFGPAAQQLHHAMNGGKPASNRA